MYHLVATGIALSVRPRSVQSSAAVLMCGRHLVLRKGYATTSTLPPSYKTSPPSTSAVPTSPTPSPETPHSPLSTHPTLEPKDPLDTYLSYVARSLLLHQRQRSSTARWSDNKLTSVPILYEQYKENSGLILDHLVVGYEEYPKPNRRADRLSKDVAEVRSEDGDTGDGLVLVAHVLLDEKGEKVEKICICSGFVVDAKAIPAVAAKGSEFAAVAAREEELEGEVIVTCAHTLEEMYRHIRQEPFASASPSFSFILPSSPPPSPTSLLLPSGCLEAPQPIPIRQTLSSMPRSDLLVLQTEPLPALKGGGKPRLRSLPLTPYPVPIGTPLLTHLFGSPSVPVIQHSRSRTVSNPAFSKESARSRPEMEVERAVEWIGAGGKESGGEDVKVWRRWGKGEMLGYRSYTGLEVEAGTSHALPHLLSTILPTPGSSGGPLVRADTGAVVGMISGRRMDNRVEGERGWGASAEGIFEMFSLPGFTPASRRR